jgi:hypothetical protein
MAGEEIVAFGFLVLWIVAIILFYRVLKPTRSRKYRRELTNLYVAARIKQVAKEDNIDLSEEYEAFKKWCKQKIMEEKPLDDTIELELQDKIVDSTKSKQGGKQNG